MTKWRMPIAWWISKATKNTMGIYIYYLKIFFTATMVARPCLNVTFNPYPANVEYRVSS
jgi:hypothetical protein